ncbi:MAG: SlyX family protein [Gammaproteobacteria bacterium]|nr:SlyX family protein [Gammaproteobacteria bacterium]
MNDRMVELETRLAFLEDTVNALDNIVAGHEQKIERLQGALMLMQKELRAMDDNVSGDEQAPPHY